MTGNEEDRKKPIVTAHIPLHLPNPRVRKNDWEEKMRKSMSCNAETDQPLFFFHWSVSGICPVGRFHAASKLMGTCLNGSGISLLHIPKPLIFSLFYWFGNVMEERIC